MQEEIAKNSEVATMFVMPQTQASVSYAMAASEKPPLADRLRSMREAKGMTQQDLAVAAGLSVSMVAQIEQGQRADPRASTVSRLAEALGATVDALLGSSQKPAGGAKGKRKK